LVLDGVEGQLVVVEAQDTFDVEQGRTKICGLPDASVREGALRMRLAVHPFVQDAAFKFAGGVLLNLAPADVRKAGRTLDLALAMAYAGLLLDVDRSRLKSLLFLGETALDGEIRSVPGVLAAALEAKRHGLGLVLPAESLAEAALIEGPALYPVRYAFEAFDVVLGGRPPVEVARGAAAAAAAFTPDHGPDLAEVRGQYLARRALEIAAAGGHNLLFEGPPGSGKTMLARRMPGILPPLEDAAALEAALVLSSRREVDLRRFRLPPFRSPHHTASAAGLAGGGNPIRPGEISLAHRGVLFLDELPEFSREALEVLREPMEERRVHVTRAGRTRTLPADCLIVAAMNPCPCGFAGAADGRCRCGPPAVRRYTARLSGPLLDRFDLRVRLRPVPAAELIDAPEGEPSAAVRARVVAARSRQRARGALNADLDEAGLRKHAALGATERGLYRRITETHRLSARGAKRLLRTARTLADLEGAPSVGALHLNEAASFRLPSEIETTP
jgi:magnesium chelatase family protein